ncbi:MAG: LLM class flavin-dependent oxidoreductase [Acidobacteriota bacterium]|nr:LLM class flavin-dependent oxidoreductase [Acidobacteriota bacterium]
MKFGMFIDLQLPRPWKEGDEHRLFQESLEQVELGDRIGIDYVWAQEHHFLEEYCHSAAPEVFLAACSQRTTQIRLGHGIMVMNPNFNHPARVAERIATLDLVSNGRCEWGTGESGTRMELEGFGVNFADKRPMWAEGVREAARMLTMSPYPAYQGRYFSMPTRNLVPKSLQKPHPPMWMACSNRDSLKLAARLGLGALTFAFLNSEEAKFWVDEYYETFKNECTPIGRTVNPNIAMLSGFMCHEDSMTALERGFKGAQFFTYGLGHYWRDGQHQPGVSSLWENFDAGHIRAMDFADNAARAKAGTGGIGSPAEIVENFAELEKSGVDQLILLHQSGNYKHSHICESLDLFGRDVLPEFIVREKERQRKKDEELAPYIEQALSRIPPLEEMEEVPTFDAYPCFGMAETTLMVTGGQADKPPVFLGVDRGALEKGRIELCDDPEQNYRITGNGCSLRDQTILIVDPVTTEPCPPDVPGEIWVSGPGITQGYWQRPEATARAFPVRDGVRYLRTGDLGFIRDGELFIGGRLKDVITIRGRQIYPQDLERSCIESHDDLNPNGTAAFSIQGNDGEEVVLVAEVTRPRLEDPDAVLSAVRTAVADEHQIQPAAIVLIRGFTLPKTTSGKVQRGATRQAFTEGTLRVIADSREREYVQA